MSATRLGPVVVERRAIVSRRSLWLVRVLAIVLAFLVGAAVLAASGFPVLSSYERMWEGAFGSGDAFAETLVGATPLIFTGLAFALAARMLLWNIGAEGQLFIGATLASAVAFTFEDWPRGALLPFMVLAGAAGGALWGGIPGVLRAHLGVNEIITTLMLNFVAILWVDWLVHGTWRDPESSGFPLSTPFTDSATLPALFGTRLHAGLFVALAAAVVVWAALRYTRWGYEVRVIGESPAAARYAGMPTARNIVLVMAVSGALAGVAGMSEVSGIVHRIQSDISPGYGFTGIIVATLAGFSPLGVTVAAILFGALQVGGLSLQTASVPTSIVNVLQGSILFITVGAELLARYRLGWFRSPEELAADEQRAIAEEVRSP